MKRRNATRNALLMSVLSMLLCVSMLVGTTFAWFTDSVTSANNIIKSGTLDVEMMWADGTEDPAAATWKDASKGAIFNYDLWEPGYTEVRHIKIANEGTLALKYQVQIRANGEVSDLADVIDVYYVDPAVQVADRTKLTDANKIGTLTEVLNGMATSANGSLEAGQNVTLTIALKMQESAGNEYQNLSIGSDFSIVLLATQFTSEDDSFDEYYDEDSLWPEVSVDNVTKEENEETSVKNEDGSVKVDIPAEAPEGNYSLVVTDKDTKTDAEGNTVASMDIILLKDGVKVSDGNEYTVSVKIGTGLNLTKVTHNGDEISDYDYNDVSGVVTFTTTGFSPFAFTYKEGDNVAAIGDNRYSTLAEAFAKAEAGAAITLLKDVTVDADTTINVAKSMTLDLNGKTLAGVSDETGKNASIIVVGKGGELTVKNGTVTMKHEGTNMEWNNSTNALEAVSGGKLTLDKVTVKNLGGSDMAYGVNIGNNGGATLKTVNSTIESANYVALRVFNNADGDINIDLTEGTELKGEGSPFFVHFWSAADLGNKQAARQAFLDVKFNDTKVSRYSGSKSLFRFGFTDAIYYSDSNLTEVVVGNADALVWALENGKNVLFNNDIKIDPANMSNAYGTTGINVKYGQTIDGNGFTLDVKGAGGTWDSGINTTGGVIKNIKVTGSFRGIFINHTSDHSEKVVLENVILEGVTYTISCDQGMYQGIEATNCTFNGWTSFAKTAGNAKFVNCSFGEGSGYAYCRPYSDTEFVNCTFSEDYVVDTTQANVIFTDCTNPNG